MSRPNQPGFVLPSAPDNSPQQPIYPAYPTYPAYPQPQQHPPNLTQPFPAPIQHQPGGFGAGGHQTGNWHSGSAFQLYLSNAQSFHVKQKVELLEAIVGWETGNKYTVKDQAGNKVFLVGEESGCFPRQLCGKIRPFTLTVKDTLGNNVLIMDRDLNCTCFCGLICPDSLTVSTPGGQKLGTVVEKFNLLYPVFDINDSFGKTVLKIEGPLCPIACGGAVSFRILDLNGVSVGTISKEWGGLVRELFTDADYFSVSFPINLDSSIKAVVLGALFLIDFEFFEAGHNGKQGNRRLFG